LRDIDKEQEQILNGNRFVVNTDEATGVFQRDVDKLFHQYRNLRMSIFNHYKESISDLAAHADLMSYIDEQFIRLVKEYSINGEVDFPGYIKTKLHYRVKHSYIKSVYRDRNRVFTLKKDGDISTLLEKTPCDDEELDYYAAVEYALQGVEMTDLEKEILFYLIQEMPEPQIVRTIKANHSGEKLASLFIKENIRQVQTFIRTKLESALEY
jgi:hypothetical protein